MNPTPRIDRRASICPHDCPSACSLDVEVIDGKTIGRVHGAQTNTYTAGVICAKVARYAERIHHPDRLLYPLKRTGPKGSGQFERITWDEALDLVAEKFLEAERTHGPEAVWPYYYAGTMGLAMRDGINRLRHVKKYSGQFSTICTNMAWTGYIAGTGKLLGPDPREMALSDCVVIWGTNPVHTQVNVMTHAMRARKERGAKIVAIDVYMNATMKQADMALLVRPGTDGALACAVMHVLFRDGHANWDYLGVHGLPGRPGSASAQPRSGMGVCDHRLAGRGDRGVRRLGRGAQAHLFSPRLRLRPPAQRRGQHACGRLHRGRHGSLAARGRRRLPQQRRHLPLAQEPHRGARRLRSEGPQARPVPDRPRSHGRPGGPAAGPARDRDADPEHQSGLRRAGAGTGEAGLCPRGSVRRACTSSS